MRVNSFLFDQDSLLVKMSCVSYTVWEENSKIGEIKRYGSVYETICEGLIERPNDYFEFCYLIIDKETNKSPLWAKPWYETMDEAINEIKERITKDNFKRKIS